MTISFRFWAVSGLILTRAAESTCEGPEPAARGGTTTRLGGRSLRTADRDALFLVAAPWCSHWWCEPAEEVLIGPWCCLRCGPRGRWTGGGVASSACCAVSSSACGPPSPAGPGCLVAAGGAASRPPGGAAAPHGAHGGRAPGKGAPQDPDPGNDPSARETTWTFYHC